MFRRISWILAVASLLVGCVSDPPPAVNSTTASGDDAGTDAAQQDSGNVNTGTVEPAVARSNAGLLVYYPVRDEPVGELIDASPNQRDIRLESTGVVQNGVLTLGSNESITPPQSIAMLEAMRGGFTFETWVQLNGNIEQDIVDLGGLRITTPARMATQSLKTICVVDCAIGDTNHVVNAMRPGERQHVVVTGADDVVTLYVDGTLLGAWQTELDSALAGDAITIGSNANTDVDYSLLAIYGRALSAGEVMSHFYAGPDAAPSIEVDRELRGLVAVTASAGLHDGIPTAITIRSEMQTISDSMRVSTTDHALLILRTDQAPESEELLAASIQGALEFNQLQLDGELEIFRMRTQWNQTADWQERLEGTAWDNPGGASAIDRQDLGSSSIGPTGGGPRGFYADATDVVREWDTGSPNYGFMFTCNDGCAGQIFHDRSWNDAFGVRLNMLYSVPLSGSAPPPPANFTAQQVGESYELTWESDTVVEVWMDGRLRLRTTEARVAIPATAGVTLETRAVDPWGRPSAFVRTN